MRAQNICILKREGKEVITTQNDKTPHATCANRSTYSERQLLASEDPDPRDGTFLVIAKQEDTSKSIFPKLVQALEHTC